MSEAPLIRLEGVGKDFPRLETAGHRLAALAGLVTGRSEIPHFRALDGVDLELRRGESLGIVGPNGAGKSTLLKIISGVVRATRGTVAVNARISALLELGSGFHPDYTGRENIELSAALLGYSRRELDAKLDRIIDFADIGEHVDQPVKHYSSGMVVRLGFAIASALDPEVLVTDEVLAVGDETFQRKCIRWLEGFRAGGGTLLLVSHSMYHVQSLCARAIWIDSGRIRAAGSSHDVTRDYLTWHEERAGPAEAPARSASRDVPHLVSWRLAGPGGATADVVAMGDDLECEGVAHGPEGRAPALLFGIVRADGTPVYGAHSQDAGFRPRPLGDDRFGFRLRLPRVALLPGKYHFRLHALDPEGLRLFDTVQQPFVVSGKTRDYGLARLDHEWVEGEA